MTDQTVNITITADEARTLKYLLIKEERVLGKLSQPWTTSRVSGHEAEEAAELTALRQKIHNQI